MTKERFELYQRVPPPGGSIPVYLDPLILDNLVLEEDVMDGSVCHLRLNKAGGPVHHEGISYMVLATGRYWGGVTRPLTRGDGC